eukprot:TRINITY_DN89306_c0_g1_i1.p1 TRINITY_DN89306_c0_g1~~TRINITY_DN89306_c0_g1_i1.p1  ORF type:complete len:924 (+),score=108.78 TRINITY_DN89306_c0_g1_i1:64-2835(+)
MSENDEPERLGCLSAKMRRQLGNCFVCYANFCTRRPRMSLAISFIFVLCCCPGFVLLKFDSDDSNMYLRGSYGNAALHRCSDIFPFNPGNTATMVYFQAYEGKNLFDAAVLVEIGRAVDRVLSLTTKAGDRFSDVCENSWRGHCEVESTFHSFRANAASLGVSLAPQVEGMGETESLAFQFAQFCTQSTTACQQFIAPQEKALLVSTPGSQGSASPQVVSMVVTLYLNPSRKDSQGIFSYEAYQDAVFKDIHGPGYETKKDNLRTDNFYTINYSNAASVFEGSRPATEESTLMALTFLLINAFVWSAIAAPTAPRSRGLLACTCMLVVVLSLACSIGLSSYVTVPFTPLTTLVIFTLFGVSVDDIIVIVHSYDRAPGTPTLENANERIALSLQESGPAITLTSATSLVAFLCAAMCPIPNISYFCVTASFGIFTIFVLQLTLFLPIFILDERRRLKQRHDCCLSLCLGSAQKSVDDGTGSSNTKTTASKVMQVLTAPSVGGGCGLVDAFAKAMAKNDILQCVLAFAFAAMVGIGIYGASIADSDADLTNYYIDTSFMKEHFRLQSKFWSSPTPFYLAIEHQHEGLFTDSHLAELDSIYDELTALDFTQKPHDHWLRDFEAYLNFSHPGSGGLAAERIRLQGDAKAFGARVSEFLDSPSFAKPNGELVVPWRQKRNIVFEGGYVKYSRLSMMYETDFGSQARYISNFHKSIDIIFPNGYNDKLEKPKVSHTFGFSALYPVAERDERMKAIIFENLAIASAAVAIVVMLMLNPLVGLFVGALVLSLDAIILALLTLYGSKLDFVAFLCLSMTIGLVVDYSTHTAHTYMHHPGSPNEKLYRSMSKMGASVLSGGGSTLLGICVLAFASSEAFRTFFKVLSTAILMGTVVGITVSPVLLRILHGVGLAFVGFYRNRLAGRSTSDVDV